MANVLTPEGGIFRPPRGGRRRKDVGSCLVSIFLSTPSVRRANLCRRVCRDVLNLSIHALREEDDQTRRAIGRGRPSDFYPRPPRGGRRDLSELAASIKEFLSTPSARRATFRGIIMQQRQSTFLSTPSARRATSRASASASCRTFLSTPSVRRATNALLHLQSKRPYFYPRPP